ncbi:hypothetical protein M9435_005549 [Picochlorum sp. BPE23]|nr:hypothetical protein M9435_005549 [Picochlorum sp. BPE23]
MKQKEGPVILAPPKSPMHLDFGGSVSMDAAGSWLVVGASVYMKTDYDDTNFLPLAYVYEKNGKKWTLVKTLTLPNWTANAGLDIEMVEVVRVSMSGSGKAILVTYYYEKNPQKYNPEYVVCLYRRDKKGRWVLEQEFLPPKQFVVGGGFGAGMAIDYSGNTVLILGYGAKVYNNARGAGFVYARKNGRWKFVKRLKDTNATEFGYSGALDAAGTTAVLSGMYGPPKNSKSQKKVVIFQIIDGKWKRTKSLPIPWKKGERGLSIGVAIDGTGKTIAAMDPNTGTCYMYDKKKKWTLFDTITVPSANLSVSDSYETMLITGSKTLESVALSESGSRMALGVIDMCEDCDFSGIVRVYRKGTKRWKLEYELSSPTKDVTMGTFGYAVSINSRYLAVGEPIQFEYLGGSGNVAVFEDSSS